MSTTESKMSFLTCSVKYEAVIKNSIEQEVVGRDAEFSTAVIVATVACDDGVQLHLEAHMELLRRRLGQEALRGVTISGRCITFLVDGGTGNLIGWNFLL